MLSLRIGYEHIWSLFVNICNCVKINISTDIALSMNHKLIGHVQWTWQVWRCKEKSTHNYHRQYYVRHENKPDLIEIKSLKQINLIFHVPPHANLTSNQTKRRTNADAANLQQSPCTCDSSANRNACVSWNRQLNH